MRTPSGDHPDRPHRGPWCACGGALEPVGRHRTPVPSEDRPMLYQCRRCLGFRAFVKGTLKYRFDPFTRLAQGHEPVNVNDAFPSKFLKAADLPDDEDMILTITAAAMESIGQDDKKIVLKFRETDRGLVLNKVNTKTIAKIHGDETDEWLGKKIALYATEVEYQGETVMGLRVRLKAPKAAKAAATPAMPLPTEGEDIPF